MKMNAKTLTRGALIAALYAAVTLILTPISYGDVQLRVSEAMTLLPIIWPEAIPGLFVGCFLANLIGPSGIVDAVVGGLATLIAAFMTYKLRGNKWLAALPPVLVNAVVIGIMLNAMYEVPLMMTMLFVGVGQAVSCYALGIPLLALMNKIGLAQRL